MRLLKEGMSGEDVQRWQEFLRGQFPSYSHSIVTDGKFGPFTTVMTRVFEKSVRIPQDGVVDNAVYAAAALRGFPLVTHDPSPDVKSPGWPEKPTTARPLTASQRAALFGDFEYVAAPTKTNAEAIRILSRWSEENVTIVEVPQLKGVTNAPKKGVVTFHRKLEDQMKSLWAAWDDAALLDRVLTWNGSFVPRFVRGSRKTLSNHSWATAFDINVAWNPLGSVPAIVGMKGSVRELVGIAFDHGFYWGGWFSRLDGMHFEAYKIL